MLFFVQGNLFSILTHQSETQVVLQAFSKLFQNIFFIYLKCMLYNLSSNAAFFPVFRTRNPKDNHADSIFLYLSLLLLS